MVAVEFNGGVVIGADSRTSMVRLSWMTLLKVLDDLGHRAEDAGIAASAGAQQLPLKLEGRSRDIEHELNRTVQVKY